MNWRRQRGPGSPSAQPLCVGIASLLLISTLLGGCGESTPAAPHGDGGHEMDAPIDAPVDASSDRSVADAPGGWCSELCGPISGPDALAPDAWIYECPPGTICGETGGVQGFVCCNPAGTCEAVGPPSSAGCP